MKYVLVVADRGWYPGEEHIAYVGIFDSLEQAQAYAKEKYSASEYTESIWYGSGRDLIEA